MKLYSRSTVLGVVLLAVIVSSIVTLVGAFLFSTLTGPASLQQTAVSLREVAPPVRTIAETSTALGDQYTPDERENISIYQNLNEGVVNITTEVLGYNWFLEAVPQSGGTGSGSIIDAKGYILTNQHVVANAVKVTITLYDGSTYEGSIVGKDLENDLAVVKFDPKGKKLTTIPMGASKGLKVGQKVLAIGNPFALDRTLTTGIVSALGRPLKSDNGIVLHELIQTDASINPGNSGGPLLNSQGQIIGINTMIFSPSGGSVGIGFAVPVDTARRIVPELIQYGHVIRGWLDITPVQLFPQLVRYAGLPVNKGVLVSQVAVGGQAQKAGLRGGDPRQGVRYSNSILYLGGDIITAINDIAITSLADLYSALESSRPGDVVKVRLMRGASSLELRVPLVQRTEQDQPE